MTTELPPVLRGKKIIWASLALTLLIWISTLSSYRFILQDPFLFLSKIAALLGTVSMCWTFILSTRQYFFESMLSGLDKVYHTHRIMGISSFSLICLHVFFQLLRLISHFGKGSMPFHFRGYGAVELGIASFVLFSTLIILTLWIKLPYHIWKKTHEFFIFVLLLGFFHSFWINKQINQSILLSIWIYGFIFVATLSYLYIRFLYRYLGPRHHYSIKKIEKRGKVWNIHLDPLGKKIQYRPAQFIYISFDHPKLGKEIHPFSVSSSPEEDLRVSIKAQGDYTCKLDVLCPGNEALIWGPYGKFYEKFLCETQKDVVFIAAGIGIAPFLSMLQFEVKHPEKRKIHVFYCVKNQKRAYFDDEIKSLKEISPSIHYTPWYSDTQDFLKVENIKQLLQEDLRAKNYFLCGPFDMMHSFMKQLNQHTIPNRQIVFEDFNLLD